MKKVICFVLAVCIISQLSATTHYASPNGTAAYIVSSPANPMTLDFAYFSCAPGDSLLLEGIFTMTQNLYVTLNDLYIGEYGTGGFLQGDYDNTTAGFPLITLRYPTNVTIENLTFYNHFGNESRGILMWGTGDNINIRNNVFSNIGWNTDPTEIAGYDEGSNVILVLGNVNSGSLTNVSIIGNSITNCVLGRSEAITLIGNVDGFLVADNYISDVTNIGIDAAGHFDWVADYDTGVLLDPALNQARNGIVRNNSVIRALSPIATSAGLYCDGCTNVVFERNIVKECGTGMSIGCEVGGNKTASNVTVINNIFAYNQESGMFIGSLTSEGSVNGPSSVDDCIIRNNTFYANCQTDGALTFNDYEIFLQNSKNNVFKNNILYMLNTGRGIVAAGTSTVVNFEMDYNLFFRDNLSETDLVISSTTSTLSGNAHSQYGNPGFTGTATDLFEISVSSRAANAGDPLTTLLTGELDRDGGIRIQDLRSDIGAQESSSTQSPPIPNTEFAICDAFLIQSTNQTIVQSESYIQHIETNGIIAAGSSIVYTAEDYVLMTEGFEAMLGSVYHAYMASCQ